MIPPEKQKEQWSLRTIALIPLYRKTEISSTFIIKQDQTSNTIKREFSPPIPEYATEQNSLSLSRQKQTEADQPYYL